MAGAFPEETSRSRSLPRYRSREIATVEATEHTNGSGDWASNAEAGGYRQGPSQRPNVTAGPDPGYQYPPLPAALPMPRNDAGVPPLTTSALDTQMGGITLEDKSVQGGATAFPDQTGEELAALAEYPYSVYNHGTWTAADDRTLIMARSRGQNWADLQRAYFPTKTANACRKRYERLVERRGIHDYSARKLEMVANEYMNMRKEIWSGLAERVGMKWEVVESLCMSAGLRTIQSNARSYTNRSRRDNRISQKTREAQAEAAAAGPLSSAVPAAGPIGTGFGVAFARKVTGNPELSTTGSSPGHNTSTSHNPPRSNAGIMPPPPLIPPNLNHASLPGSLPRGQQVPFDGYLNGRSQPESGQSREPQPPVPGRGQDWVSPTFRGPV
ncbi:hypothetical protein N656DRAFT_774178 [Canariomyces notabilis]|uniref:Myb-like domain-containing protein n=1 Tax=Canariomyces notabilis TaxID=2074819 RepID=A0AAN6TKZ9_9PEZI|nr:hypothetical protein N656DRAFT_774178 [Canariomyces arenarius]